ncbi:cytoplasmic protein [Bacillus mangrovi]|uniref:Cytoplasmic protein n=1 Tax=Metabacillus mangrovi TaxID=1491830 RepID=A0A7X2V5Z2_9BACI|nr:DUF6434 domain-containing protein [Metabacillus mangrovi]MTH54930.1 cytoplasmic protein [Metabacillus mangrovi]
MRPHLNAGLNPDTFKDYYWLKEELQSFCRENGLSASGSKIEISRRIEAFLRTGEILKPLKKHSSNGAMNSTSILNLDTVIAENHRCSQQVREFFKTVIPAFHFSSYIQNYFKTNAGKTYRDAVNAWHGEEARKKDPSYVKSIAPQFEYNQFTRDYYADPENKGKSRGNAIAAWNEVKKLPGSNRYRGVK